MPYFNSGSWKSLYDPTRKGRVTTYSWGNTVVQIIKSTNASASIDAYSLNNKIAIDSTQLYSYRTNEIPIAEYISQYKKTPFVNTSSYITQYSPWCNLAFRHLNRPRGYSRILRTSSIDYLDEKFVSSSFPLFENSHYLNSDIRNYTFDERMGAHKTNKFYSEEINCYDNFFYHWGSGSISMSHEYYWDSDRFNNIAYYKNTKNAVQQQILDKYGRSRLSNYAISGDGFDNTQSRDNFVKSNLGSPTFFMTNPYKCNVGLIYNENWSFGYFTYSPDNTYENKNVCIGYVNENGTQSRSYLPNEYIEHPCPTSPSPGEICQLWRISGRSGSFEIKLNNADVGHNETVNTNVGILRSYYDGYSNTQYTASWGSVTDPTAYGGFTNTVYQYSCSMIINSLDTPMSASSLYSYNEVIFSIVYPIVNTDFESKNYLGETQGFVIGEFVSRYSSGGGGKFYYYQLPLINFDVDGEIKILACDQNYKAYFKNIGMQWNNNIIYKVCYFISTNKLSNDDNKNQYFELVINDKFMGKFPLNQAIGAIFYSYFGFLTNVNPSYFSTLTLANSWIWAGSIYTNDYDEYKIYCIRRTKFMFDQGNINTIYPTLRANWSINRNPTLDKHYNLKKKYGSTNFGIGNAVSISCSEFSQNNLLWRHPTYDVEKLSKTFYNNSVKDWYVNVYYLPAEGGW